MLAWLGEHIPKSAELFRLVESEDWDDTDSDDREDALKYLKKHNLREFEQRKNMMKDVATRPYWKRTWIVQEVVLAQRVWFMCGDSSHLALEKLSCYFLSVIWSLGLSDECCTYANHTYNVLTRWETPRQHRTKTVTEDHYSNITIPPPSRTIFRLMTHFSDTQCADQRDRIYSPLSLEEMDLWHKINLNYGNEDRISAMPIDYTVDLGTLSLRFLLARWRLSWTIGWAPCVSVPFPADDVSVDYLAVFHRPSCALCSQYSACPREK